MPSIRRLSSMCRADNATLIFLDNQIGIVETMYQGHLSYVNVSLYHKDYPNFSRSTALGQNMNAK